MPSATASGADKGSASARQHSQGNQDKKYTPEQKAAVIRIRKCSATAFYEILALQKTATESEIKKAYRKQSLLTHPDKNGYDGADEAFKMVSRAFQILSDEDKKAKYDRFGVDPDSRFSASAESSGPSPFSGFSGRSAGAGGSMFNEEVSPEELFNRFFGGGMGAGPFGGPQFVFNMGGGPRFNVHQFGGFQPRRRPHPSGRRTTSAQRRWEFARNLLPFVFLFILPLLSSLWSASSSTPRGPTYRFDAVSPHILHRTTPRLSVNYYVNPVDVESYSARKFSQLDQRVEVDYVTRLRYQCESEVQARDRMIQDAQGWFFPDEEKMKRARAMELKSCQRLNSLKGKY